MVALFTLNLKYQYIPIYTSKSINKRLEEKDCKKAIIFICNRSNNNSYFFKYLAYIKYTDSMFYILHIIQLSSKTINY